MDQNTQQVPMTNIPNATSPSPIPSGHGEKRVGPIIAVLIIVLVLIIAALYLFASRVSEPITPSDDYNADAAAMVGEQQVQPITNESTDLTDIQADLDMSADGLDSQNF